MFYTKAHTFYSYLYIILSFLTWNMTDVVFLRMKIIAELVCSVRKLFPDPKSTSLGFFYTVKFTVPLWPDMITVRTSIKQAENPPNGSISHQWLLVMYISLAAAPDSDLWTLFPVESHVERSEQGSSQTLDLFLVSQGHDVKIKRFNNTRNAARVRVSEIVSKDRNKYWSGGVFTGVRPIPNLDASLQCLLRGDL